MNQPEEIVIKKLSKQGNSYVVLIPREWVINNNLANSRAVTLEIYENQITVKPKGK